jgi:probable F420-dependent oxidoreductase
VKVRIGLGISAYPFESARAFFRWVDVCEASDVDSIWQTDRLVGEQPQLEAMSTMAALAGATERLKFGMNAVVVGLRDPLVLARECATIDYLSGGRLLPVFGVGNEHAPEWKATATSPRGRGRRADEALEIMRRLWSEERVSFEGEFYRYRDASISPRPLQDPLPLWIGGASPAAVRRTAQLGTGWLGGIQTPELAGRVVAEVREASRDAGRPIPEDHYGIGFPFRFGGWDDPLAAHVAGASFPGGVRGQDYFVVGGAPAILERIDAYRKVGLSKFVLIPLARGDDELMEQTRRVIEEVLPRVQS